VKFSQPQHDHVKTLEKQCFRWMRFQSLKCLQMREDIGKAMFSLDAFQMWW